MKIPTPAEIANRLGLRSDHEADMAINGARAMAIAIRDALREECDTYPNTAVQYATIGFIADAIDRALRASEQGKEE